MNNEIIFSVEESIDGGYEAKAIGFSIFSQSETYEELIDNLRDAVKCHFDKDELPKLITLLPTDPPLNSNESLNNF